MPRGIPKDPNHPRNKARVDAAPAAAPKKRGRPPGSGKKAAVAETQAAAPKAKKADTSVAKNSGNKIASASVISHDGQNDEALATVRSNIRMISEAIQHAGSTPSRQTMLDAQLQKLIELSTVEEQSAQDDDEPEEKPAPIIATPTPVPTLAAVPTQTQGGNNLPTPPSFVPPPFPSPVPQ